MSADSCSIALVGDGGAGKTSLTIRGIVQIYDPTIEDSHRAQVTVNKQTYHVEVLDTAGQEEYNHLVNDAIRTVDGFAVVFSVDSQKTFDLAVALVKKIKQSRPASPVVLVGNKVDMPAEDWEITRDSATLQAKNLGCPILLTSAKTGLNVDLVFITVVQMLRKSNPTRATPVPQRTSKNQKCVIC
ncbi:rasG protein [Exidia glandulosa HHB12029]|uniref:RasG protein n=1 Tax=Exidia glandulosa HHB12029 TaxID=1314781 RepID=A0A166BD73_EXIGL|nr:rasG protein [Exidia glandulosa HHB12029]